jgi:hypothetical protein
VACGGRAALTRAPLLRVSAVCSGMACTELMLAAAEVPNIQFKGLLLKRGGGMFKGWNHRYFVIGSNFLFEYLTEKVCCCAVPRCRRRRPRLQPRRAEAPPLLLPVAAERPHPRHALPAVFAAVG